MPQKFNGVFDSHFHIIDERFPLVPNQGYLPSSFTVQDYQKQTAHLNIKGGAVVSGSFQAFDQTYLKAALKKLGPSFFGVTQLPASTSDKGIQELHDAGVRAIRFNLKRGGSESVEHIEAFGKRVFEIARWHVELYVDSRDLPELTPLLLELPSYSIDHLGLSKEGLPHLLGLVEKGAKVKATGFGRVDFDVSDALKEIHKANPSALMFGTDLPSTRAPRPFQDEDLQLILDTFDEKDAEKILSTNALEFYD